MAVALGTAVDVPNPNGMPSRAAPLPFMHSRSVSEGTTGSEISTSSTSSENIPRIRLPKRHGGASSENHSPASSPRLDPVRPKSPSTLSKRASSFFKLSNSSVNHLISENASGNSSTTSLDVNPEDKKKRGNVLRKTRTFQQDDHSPPAWVYGYRGKVPYDLDDLMNARPLPELWDESGDCFVYLFPKESRKPASFKVKSNIFASSRRLYMSAIMNSSRTSLGYKDTERHLYMSIDDTGLDNASVGNSGSLSDEQESLLSIRNLFAFLMQRSLVATQRCPTVFDIFLSISKQLKFHEFSNIDGSSFGQVVTTNFDEYVDEFELADVRFSDQKTAEGIVLGERMRNIKLYNEAFTHAAGKYEFFQKTKCTSMSLISSVTRNRLGRAALNLEKHTSIVQQTLDGLEFPSLFTGLLSSRGGKRQVDLGHWRDSFVTTRKWYIHFYKGRYKKWPPKTTRCGTGINRQIFQDLYRDLCSVYDLLVDRTRTESRETQVNNNPSDANDARVNVLRQILDEYNFSSPPVKPSIPFNIPIFPSTCPAALGLDRKAAAKKIKDEDLLPLLRSSHNTDVQTSEFTEAFKEMERKSAHSHKLEELTDIRIGQWIFIYAMLQVFPLLAIDAPGLEHTAAVEYFLCEPPRSGVPWARHDDSAAAPSRSHSPILGVPMNARVAPAVSLPADLAGPAIESNFYRSHCWIRADEWNGVGREAVEPPVATSRPGIGQRAITAPLLSTSASFGAAVVESEIFPPRASSLATSASSQSLNVPKAGARTDRAARTVSVYDPTKTFDSFLSTSNPDLRSRSSSPMLGVKGGHALPAQLI